MNWMGEAKEKLIDYGCGMMQGQAKLSTTKINDEINNDDANLLFR